MKKKYYGFLMALALLFAFNAKVSATEVSAEETISSKLASASDGILEVAEGTFTESTIAITEDMTIKGAGKDKTIITGKITVDGDAKLTLENVTIKSGDTEAKTISLTNGADLEVKNSIIYSNNEDSIDFTGNSSGIYAEGDSTIDVISTTIYAKYAIYAKGGNNEINIKDNSSINGYAAVDVSNGIDGEVVEGNKVTIDSSTLTGYNETGEGQNDYGTIVFGAQKGLKLNITKSTITNSVTGDSKEDLILFSDAYNLSSETEIEITDSTLKNTDNEKGSVIYNLGETDSVSTNIIAVSNSETEGKEYADDGESIYITLSTVEGDIVTLFKKDTINETLEAFLDVMSKSLNDDEYIFEGYYIDDKYENKFNVEDEITENTKIYMKVSEKKAEEVDAPNTFDGITSYILIGIISFVACLSLGLLFKKKLEN